MRHKLWYDLIYDPDIIPRFSISRRAIHILRMIYILFSKICRTRKRRGCPTGIPRRNDVELTSMRSNNVASTSV